MKLPLGLGCQQLERRVSASATEVGPWVTGFTVTCLQVPATGENWDERSRVRASQHQQLEWESQVIRSVCLGVGCWGGPEGLYFPQTWYAWQVCMGIIH